MNGLSAKIMLAVLCLMLPFSGIGALYLLQLSNVIGFWAPTTVDVHDYAGTEFDAAVTTPGGVKRR